MKNKQNGFITALLVMVVALLVLGGGTYIYFNKQQKTPVANQVKNSIATTSDSSVNNQTSSSTQDKIFETKSWQTYTNSKYGFQIKYPPYFSIETSGLPDEGTSFKNNNSNINIAWVDVGSNVNMKGPISYKDAAPEKADVNYEKGGTVRILKNFIINNKRAVTYESLGYPSRMPGVTTIIETSDGGSIIVDVYGQKEIDINKLKKNDYSEYSDLEHINDLMISTFNTQSRVYNKISDDQVASALSGCTDKIGNETIKLTKNDAGKDGYGCTDFYENTHIWTDIITHGDLNGDGYEDAIVKYSVCGGSCGTQIKIVINQKDQTGKVLDFKGFNGVVFKGGGADQTVVSKISIDNNGIISITAQGFLDQPNWNTVVTKKFKLVGDNLVEVN